MNDTDMERYKTIALAIDDFFKVSVLPVATLMMSDYMDTHNPPDSPEGVYKVVAECICESSKEIGKALSKKHLN
jgi:hypothetical protein